MAHNVCDRHPGFRWDASGVSGSRYASMKCPLCTVDGYKKSLIAQSRLLHEKSGKEARLEAALRVAKDHIIAHHNAGKQVTSGELCPVCVREDGTEPEMNMICDALSNEAEQCSADGEASNE